MIFVSLGSQKFQFNRLLEEIDKLISEGLIKEEVVAQGGASTYEPKNYIKKDFLPKEEFDNYVSKCRILITHGGTGAIVGAVKKGKKVIAVPRRAKYGEHVDDHQEQIVGLFSEMGLILGAEVEDLETAIRKIETTEFKPYVSNTEHFLQVIEGYITGN